jgi:hypothetical protein
LREFESWLSDRISSGSRSGSGSGSGGGSRGSSSGGGDGDGGGSGGSSGGDKDEKKSTSSESSEVQGSLGGVGRGWRGAGPFPCTMSKVAELGTTLAEDLELLGIPPNIERPVFAVRTSPEIMYQDFGPIGAEGSGSGSDSSFSEKEASSLASYVTKFFLKQDLSEAFESPEGGGEVGLEFNTVMAGNASTVMTDPPGQDTHVLLMTPVKVVTEILLKHYSHSHNFNTGACSKPARVWYSGVGVAPKGSLTSSKHCRNA